MQAFMDEVTYNDRGNEVTLIKRRRRWLSTTARVHLSCSSPEIPMPTVLIVDDSAIDRSLAGGLLRKVPGLQVEFAVNGRDALGARSTAAAPTWS